MRKVNVKLNTSTLNKNNTEKNLESDKTQTHPLLKNKRGKIYKRSVETRLKISIANKGKKLNCGIKKGQTGIQHPSYKHGMGSNRDIDSEKLKAWITGVKQKNRFKCFITGETNKKNLCCHHLNAWSWCVDGRYDIMNGILIHKDIHQHFHKIFGSGNVKTEDFERYVVEYHDWGNKMFPWKQDNPEPSLSVEEIKSKSLSSREKNVKNIIELCKKRNHILQEEDSRNINSPLKIKCNIHNKEYTTTTKNYKRCIHGLPCCGLEAQKNKSLKYKRNSEGKFSR